MKYNADGGYGMPVVQLCICPCGRVTTQNPRSNPKCPICGLQSKKDECAEEEIDWFSLDAEELRTDVREILKTLNYLLKKK